MTKTSANRRYNIGFAVAGSILTILFFAFINFSTGVRFPWFIFPSYAVLWWPIAMMTAGRGSMKILSLIGSLLTIALLFVTNYITSWSYPWFLFPSFAILWWPVSMFFGKNHKKLFSIVGSIVLITFFIVTNYVTSPQYVWFYYPTFAVIFWPLSVFFAGPQTIKLYSVLGSLLIISFLTIVNIMNAPFCPWALFTYFPVLMWPAGVLLGRRSGKIAAAVTICLAGIIYYAVLNIFVFKGFPWAIFPAYALLWYPLSATFAKCGKPLVFSVIGALLSSAFFVVVNIITTPHNIWAIYPVFALAWWPLSVYYFIYRRKINKTTTADCH